MVEGTGKGRHDYAPVIYPIGNFRMYRRLVELCRDSLWFICNCVKSNGADRQFERPE